GPWTKPSTLWHMCGRFCPAADCQDRRRSGWMANMTSRISSSAPDIVDSTKFTCEEGDAVIAGLHHTDRSRHLKEPVARSAFALVYDHCRQQWPALFMLVARDFVDKGCDGVSVRLRIHVKVSHGGDIAVRGRGRRFGDFDQPFVDRFVHERAFQ